MREIMTVALAVLRRHKVNIYVDLWWSMVIVDSLTKHLNLKMLTTMQMTVTACTFRSLL
jgi:hypothetical protein